jgi:hypothetical protein
MAKEMTPQDIVKHSKEVKDAKMDWKQVYAVLHQSVESNEYRVFRHGNTLFWIHIDEPHVAKMYVFSADSYKDLFRGMKDFAKAMDLAGYKRVYGDTTDMNILNLIKRIGYPVDIQPLGQDKNGKQLYRGTVNV